MKAIARNKIAEWSFTSGRKYNDPFNDVELSVEFLGSLGNRKLVPAFWGGGNEWRVRYAPDAQGKLKYRTVCSDESNQDLHGREDEFEVVDYADGNSLLQKGRPRVAADKRHLEYSDGTPFFWMADTWWMGLCKRMDWPNGFHTLANDRVRKGFNVIQIVAGLYPDMNQFDERGANEAGFPWEKDYSRINPAYWDFADRRIAYLTEVGLIPCIVACWGYFLPWMGVDKMKRHWRNLIARYGAYPVVWCLAGEAAMAYYLSPDIEGDMAFQKKGWTELARYVQESDPFDNLLTVHPMDSARTQIEDESLLDFEMIQGGHGDRVSFPSMIDRLTLSFDAEPRMPFINAESAYEGIGETCREEVQRLFFWASMLCGAAGHTYGANGIWQVNTREKPFGPSPHGMAWGNTPWEDAYQLPGSSQMPLGKSILERFEWTRFEPHPEWIEPHWSKENYLAPFAAGIPGKVRVMYLPPAWWGSGTMKGLEKDVRYKCYLINPSTGEETSLGFAEPDENGDWALPVGTERYKLMPVFRDWVIVMEAV